MTKRYFITTPIYYANWAPHIWHAYTSLLSDIIARSKRLLWYKVKFSTWVDENWQKMIQKAQEVGKDVIEFLDDIYHQHISAWEKLNISYTDYIRTTEPRHHELVKKVIKICESKGDIYKGKYEGLYCVGCEGFKKPEDLTPEWLCPDHLKKPEVISEENYFFKLSKYQEFLENLYKSNPSFVYPDFRFNEIKAFVERWLDDFSVSRKWQDFRIQFPLDDSHVVYIWFDALFNYLTVCQWWDEEFWPADLHVMAKDIVRFHSIYWPAMLESSGYPVPKKVLAHWYFTVDGQKMSKSLGNVIEPVEIVEKYGRDAVVFYLFYDIVVWNDWDFNWERFKSSYNSMLLGWWWNLVSRVVSLSQKNWITEWKFDNDIWMKWFVENIKWYTIENENIYSYFVKFIQSIANEFDTKILDELDINSYFKAWYNLVQLSNKFMQDSQPWTKLKDESTKEEWIKDLQFLLYMIRQIGILSAPFLVDWFEKLKNILWNEDLKKINTWKDWWLTEWELKNIFEQKEFRVDLNPWYLYTKVE